MMCFGMDFFGFILFEVHSASRIRRLVPFAKFGEFSAIISLNTFSAIPSFSSSGTPMAQTLDLPHRSQALLIFSSLILFVAQNG